MSRLLYVAGSSTAPDFEKSLAPYMGPPSEIRVLYAPLVFSRYESSEILGLHTTPDLLRTQASGVFSFGAKRQS